MASANRPGVQLDFPALSLSASRFNGVLKKLDLQYNNLGDAEQLVRGAVVGRSGFDTCKCERPVNRITL